jgi:hypothetical protein
MILNSWKGWTMKKRILLLVILLLLLAMAVAAPAVTIQTPRNSGQQKQNLYQIITAWGFAVDNEAFQDATPLESLPAGDYSIQHYARYSGKSQCLGIYPVAITLPGRGDQAPADGVLLLNPKKSGNWECDLTFSEMSEFGFFDDSRKTSILLTTQNQNSASDPYHRSSGLIFDLGEINPLYAGQYIIAFDDGGKSNSLGDLDYNDLVVHVKSLPVPGTLPLVGGGLLCLWIRRFYQRLLAPAG